MPLFLYEPHLLEEFPDIRAGAIHCVGLVNEPTPEPLAEIFAEEQERVRSDLDDTPLSDLPSIRAWRRAFTSFGVKPTQYRSAIEALLRRLTKQGDIPSINTLVDMANLVSIRHRVPVAVFDQAGVGGGTTVRFANGDEVFTDLGSEGTTTPEPGEVIFVDAEGLVSARRWCWRQSRESAAGPATTEALITMEGHHEGAASDVARARDDLLGLIRRFQPAATAVDALLDSDTPGFEGLKRT